MADIFIDTLSSTSLPIAFRLNFNPNGQESPLAAQGLIELASVLITKFIHYFHSLFPFYYVKIINRNSAMLSNFALYKEKS